MMPEIASPSSPMLDAALEYLERGFAVIPVRRSDKRPYIKWEEFQHRLPTTEELESWWRNWPEANVAIVCGAISGLVALDGDGPDGTAWVEKEAQPTSVYSKTGSGGRHAFYRTPQGATFRGYALVSFPGEHNEVRLKAEAGYVIVPPSVHENGNLYEWIFHGAGWDDLPEYRAVPQSEKGSGNLNLDLSGIREPAILGLPGVGMGRRNETLARLVGRWAGKGLNFEEILLTALAWNDRNKPPLGREELERTTASIYLRHQRQAPEQDENPEPYVHERSEEQVPADLLHPGGLLQRVTDYIDTNSAASHPFFNLGAAICLLGTFAGGRIATDTGLRTNEYIILLGFSGSGKNGPMVTIPKLILKSRGSAFFGPTRATSGSALLSWIENEKNRITFMRLDEIGDILEELRRSRETPKASFFTELLTLYTNDTPENKPYASRESLAPAWHHICFLGATTPQKFWSNLTMSQSADGMLARCLIFESSHDAPFPRGRVDIDIPEKLLSDLNSIFAIPIRWDEVTMGNMHRLPVPRRIHKTEDAAELFHDWARGHHDLKNRFNREGKNMESSVHGRAGEHAHKLALIHALSMHLGDIVNQEVDLDSVSWATRLVDFIVDNTIRKARENVSINEWHYWQQRIMHAIRVTATKERPGASWRELLRQVKGISTRTMEALLATMTESGEVFKGVHKPRRGPECILYCIPMEKDM